MLAFCGGILMGLTPAPLEAWYLGWIALVPLWILNTTNNQCDRTSVQTSKYEPYLLALAWGSGYHGLALFWIIGIHPMTWMGVPWLASLSIAIVCWFLITLWGATLVVTWTAGLIVWQKITLTRKLSAKYSVSQNDEIRLFSCLSRSKCISLNREFLYIWYDILSRLIFGVAFWCLLENIWSATPLWWTSLSYTQSPHNLAILQLSQLSGFSTITAAIVAINGVIGEIIILSIKKPTQKLSLVTKTLPLCLVLLLYISGCFLYNRSTEKNDRGAIEIGIIQGNIPNQIKLYYSGWMKALNGYTNGYEKLADREVDIVLTPETALPFEWEDLVNNFNDFYHAILARRVPVWLGAFDRQGNDYTNSLFTITGDGEIFSRYDKVKLVPLGEYIPLEAILGKLINRLSPLDSHLIHGKLERSLPTPFGNAIVGICYESAFSEHFRRQARQGGEYIITASNNAYYSPAMPAQHHAQDILRAIETDRWLARATNTGYSTIIDPRGTTLWKSGINTYELHVNKIYRRQTQTLYVRWGDWLTVILSVAAIVLFLFPLLFDRVFDLR